MPEDQKHALVEFIVGEALDPVLRAKPAGRSDTDQRTLEHVQQATRAEIERYRSYGSAAAVLANFRRDLTSVPAKKVHAELRHLHLPTLEDIRDAVEDKAHALGIAAPR